MNNTSRLKIYGILAAAVIVVAGVVWFYPRNHSSKVRHSSKVSFVTKAGSTAPAKPVSPKPMEAQPRNPRLTPNDQTRGARPYTAFDDSIIRINSKHQLGFPPEQLGSLQKEYVAVADERLKAEADIAQITRTGENSYKVVIPQYDLDPELRDKFYADFDKTLAGVGKQYEVAPGLGEEDLAVSIHSQLDSENWGWGIMPQLITINYNPTTGKYGIEHTNKIDLDGSGQAHGLTIKGGVSSADLRQYYYIINKINAIQYK